MKKKQKRAGGRGTLVATSTKNLSFNAVKNGERSMPFLIPSGKVGRGK